MSSIFTGQCLTNAHNRCPEQIQSRTRNWLRFPCECDCHQSVTHHVKEAS